MEQLKTIEQTGKHMLYRVLEQENISTLFLVQKSKACNNTTELIEQVQLIHEQAAIHAADGYSRATGNVGAVRITTEYGLTNAITGIGTAQLDSVPLVIFVEHATKIVDQKLDVEGITKTSVKYNFSVNTIKALLEKTKTAIQIAKGDRPGVVVIDYPASLLEEKLEETEINENFIKKVITTKEIPEHKIDSIIKMIQLAKKPVLLVGGGTIISGANTELDTFLTQTKIPFASTLMGLGAVPVNHELHLGMVGMHGTFAANKAIHQSDLLICLGVRFSDRITGNTKAFSPNSKKIQIDIEPAEINKRVKVDCPLIGDVKKVLQEINLKNPQLTRTSWRELVSGWHKTSARFHNVKNNIIDPSKIINMLQDKAAENAIVATDVGQHQMWTAHHYSFQQPRKFLTSGGFGTMGYGLPAAIGAAVIKPNQQVICISGDGSIQMNIQELITAVRYQLNIKLVILKNGYLGMVRQWQQLFYQRNYSQVKIVSPDYVTLAESYGIKGFHAETITEAKNIIDQAFQIDGPVLMEFTIEDEQNVYPIVPPGGNNTDAIGEEPKH